MKRLIVDLDDTISHKNDGTYSNALPNNTLTDKLVEYQQQGFDIVISTSRNMRTYDGNIGKINANTLPIILEWLQRHQVPFDEIYTGKPWCGNEGFYIDDKAIRPVEFVNNTYEQIHDILNRDKFDIST